MTHDELLDILNKNYEPVNTLKIDDLSTVFEMYLSSATTDPGVPQSLSFRECYLAAITALERMFDSSKAIEPKYRGQIIAHEYEQYFKLLAQEEASIN